jgi:hypothetical protein
MVLIRCPKDMLGQTRDAPNVSKIENETKVEDDWMHTAQNTYETLGSILHPPPWQPTA